MTPNEPTDTQYVIPYTLNPKPKRFPLNHANIHFEKI